MTKFGGIALRSIFFIVLIDLDMKAEEFGRIKYVYHDML